MSADPYTRRRAQAWPRVSWSRRAMTSALAAGVALLAALPLGAQPAPAEPADAEPAEATPAEPADAEPAEATPAEPAPANAEAAPAAPAEPAEPAQPAPADAPAAPAPEAAAPDGSSAPADAVAPAAQADSVGKLSARRSWAWIAVGTAAAFATTSAMLALSVESRESDIEFLIDFRAPIVDAPNRYEGQARGRYEELVDEAETLSTYAWITLGLAGAAALTATTLFVLDGGVSAAETPGAGSQLTPAVAAGAVPGGMGVTLDWEF